MMRTNLALGFYVVVGVVQTLMGTTYFLSHQFMSYHADAVGTRWESLDVGVQTLILGLMRLAGGGWLALGMLTLALAMLVFKTRCSVARWALPAGSLLSFSASFVATWTVHQATGASTPWGPSLAMVLLTLVALGMDPPRSPSRECSRVSTGQLDVS